MSETYAAQVAREMRVRLKNLKYRETGTIHGPATNGYAYAEIPDWMLRQWISWLEQTDGDARRLREALAAAVEWGERHGERVAVGAGLGVGEWEACAPPWWRQAREALDAALAPAEREGEG